MTPKEREQIEYCLKLYSDFKKQHTANDLFKVFYEVEAKLKGLLNAGN